MKKRKGAEHFGDARVDDWQSVCYLECFVCRRENEQINDNYICCIYFIIIVFDIIINFVYVLLYWIDNISIMLNVCANTPVSYEYISL